ncbi:histidinol dehydrogenase [Thetidibacter halocola]|uniref:Histidinol dehydrogenase homolog n=1 Tax=Thetidibacter halocola TaxID=2827239 RepID=A0A8J7WHW2_9RHOB|nr:histidinol dehydrogenase [Thetidibacter halocola]MBS0125413.1 histidinol dehydrogenase [Thetidibacter halocola]
MPRLLKSAPGLPPEATAEIADTVQIMLARLRTDREEAATDYAARLDRWEGPVVVPRAVIEAAKASVDPTLMDALHYAHDNIRAFARAQRASIHDVEIELRPGLTAGQRLIPVTCAGAYVPGGRYAHIASALMTIATARAAGVQHVTAVAPPRGAEGIAPEVLVAMNLAGADTILCLGGVQGVAAMALGLFGTPEADVLCGPGNAYVAEAKRQLFGPVGIDMVAGPTDVLILADSSADPAMVALDLAGQAEHGVTSPCWLATDHEPLARAVLALMPGTLDRLPEPNRSAARAAWDAMGEVILCADRDEMAEVADTYAPEHLHVQARDLGWWRDRLRAYGSLFLGEETTVAFGDKAAGPNHVLPTGRAARHTGGLSVHKFLKCVTWQQVDDRALGDLAQATATISRAEGMVGHALTAEARIDTVTRHPRAVNH